MRLIWIISILIITVFTVKAEDVDSLVSKQVTLDEIVIQSFKQDKNLRLSPIAASVVNGTTIRNRNITSIKDFSTFIPNLFIPDYGSKLTSPVYIRGIGSKINSPSVGLYVDGMPYFEKSAFDFEFNDIEHLEVLRGPQGTLYGRNTMGGIINVYTKSPLIYKETNLNLSAGNYSNFFGSASHYGRITENIGYAISGNYTHSGGYFTNEYTGDTADPLDAVTGRFRLDWQLNPKLLLKLMTTYDYLDQGGYPYAIVDKETGKTGNVNYNNYSSYTRKISTTGATLDYTSDLFSINSQTTFQYLDDDQRIDQDFTERSLYFVNQLQTQKMFSEEINIKSNTDSRYKWLFGAFGFWQGVDNSVGMDYLVPDTSTLKLYDIPTYGIAVYHQSTIDDLFVKGLSLTAGIRYDYERASTDYTAYKNKGAGNERIDAFDSKLDFSQVTPKFALQYTFPSLQMLYATVSKGYKTGGFNTSFERNEDRSFLPEYSWNYELGSKFQWWDNRIKAELCLFYIDWKNQQIYQPLPSGRGSMLKNAGRSESKGVEASLQGNLFNGFMLQANYGFTHAKFKEYQRSETIDYSDNYLPLVPSHTFSVGVDYTLSASSLKNVLDRMTFSVNYNGTGKLYWNDDNEVSQPYYGLLNAKISATKGIITAGIWTKNITNAEYNAFYFESMGNSFAQKGRPFTIGGNIGITF